MKLGDTADMGMVVGRLKGLLEDRGKIPNIGAPCFGIKESSDGQEVSRKTARGPCGRGSRCFRCGDRSDLFAR
ncbi:protein of unknown function [Agrobacterium pusense]|uniref:Uncharacterized protein n=1 Tax=Agrobacterium pusense TaxID=648995 RepID=U4Q7L4_9HYPH|nr:protein of unknown function [Agrobacterium pusense]